MLSFPTTHRNRESILKILLQYFEEALQYRALEIASGSGEHISYFAQYLPNVTFQPSEINPRYLHSIIAYINQRRLPNIKIPLYIDVTKHPDFWPLPIDFRPATLDAVINSNMIHISAPNTTSGLFYAAGCLLKPKVGKLFLYGPFAMNGVISPESNVNFDQSLRSQHAEWGLRDVKDLEELGKNNGLVLKDIHQMPTNNHILVFYKQ